MAVTVECGSLSLGKLQKPGREMLFASAWNGGRRDLEM